MTGETIAHYRITSELGEGGIGVVYCAIDTHLGRPVAIKILRAEAVADSERKHRFILEAESASALNHPNIITIHDMSHAGEVDFMSVTRDKLVFSMAETTGNIWLDRIE